MYIYSYMFPVLSQLLLSHLTLENRCLIEQFPLHFRSLTVYKIAVKNRRLLYIKAFFPQNLPFKLHFSVGSKCGLIKL